MTLVLFTVICYGVGSLPVGRIMGLYPGISRRELHRGGLEKLFATFLLKGAKGVLVVHLGQEINQLSVVVGLFALLAGSLAPPLASWHEGDGLPAILGGMAMINPFTFQSAIALGLGVLLVTRRVRWADKVTLLSIPILLTIDKAPAGLIVFGTVAVGIMIGRNVSSIFPPKPSPFAGGDITY
ncbi:MAG: glycerol-3-phosphate acyltransferase [Bacillota bacterium]